MDTYLVTAEKVVIGFCRGESVEPRRAVAACLRSRGLAVWPELEAELFRGRKGTLLMARPVPPLCLRGLRTRAAGTAEDRS